MCLIASNNIFYLDRSVEPITTTTAPPECAGTELLEDAQTICASTGLTLRVPDCAFLNQNMDPNEFYIAGPNEADRLHPTADNTCGGKKDANFYIFEIKNELRDCGTILKSNSTHLTYTNAIQF